MSESFLQGCFEAPDARRPGIVSGERPERPDADEPLAARATRRVVGAFTTPRRVGRKAVSHWAGQVDQAASGLDALSEAAFDTALEELRAALQRNGLVASQLARGFALIREAARRTLGTPHYDVQLYGGRVMVESGLAELETGEGKTLTATLPATLAALARIPVHVITANDYLVERDAKAMGPLYERLGVSVGVVTEDQPDPSARREAYARDVTYATNKQISFDYLRDLVAGGGDRRLAKRLGLTRQDAWDAASAPVLRGLCFAIVDEADSVLIDDAGTPLILSREGQPVDAEPVRDALALAGLLEERVHYTVDRASSSVSITRQGHALLAEIGQDLEGVLAGERRREEWVHRALCVLHLYERDRHYVVQEGAVQIIDQPTGRRAPDRSFEGGVQSLIEAREGIELTPQRETLARISYQGFFRRYLRLAGMTGSGREVARELWNVYRLRTTVVPPRLPSRRVDEGRKVLATVEEKWDAVADRVLHHHRSGRPVLVGTATVAESEQLSRRLNAFELPHDLLSATQDRSEAEIVARAGQPGRITVATRMAGRGTDIQLGEDVERYGGLAVVSAELAESRRIDRQLFGRCGRQGASGSFEQIVSLQDHIFDAQLERSGFAPWCNPTTIRWLAPLLVRWAQAATERRSARLRRRLLESERLWRELLAFTGRNAG